MKLEDIQVVGKPLVLATADDVDTFASRLWITLPPGYHDYVTRLGEGTLGGNFIRIYPPWRIEKELSEWRRRISKYWFWDDGRELLPKERAVECVIIGDTVNGDEIVFHPCRPMHLFVLPRDTEQIFHVGDNLMDAIEWVCSSGELTEPFSERTFEPFDSRIEPTDPASKTSVIDPEGETLDEIVEVIERWAKRHGAKKAAQKELRKQTPKEAKGEIIYEGILIDVPSRMHVGYGVAWKIMDKETGKLIGTFCWGKGDGHEGSSYSPAKID